MTGFGPRQLKELLAPLDRTQVHSREVGGRKLDYIEGWFAISEANRIFGFAGWDREMVYFERSYERTKAEGTSCAYIARVRIRVRAGALTIIREGTGFGAAFARLTADAQERALKAAETDATKRALMTFGNRFGLTLYDKSQNGVGAAAPDREDGQLKVQDRAEGEDTPQELEAQMLATPASSEKKSSNELEAPQCAPASNAARTGLDVLQSPRVGTDTSHSYSLYDAQGELLAARLSAEGFVNGLRQVLGATPPEAVEALQVKNEAMLMQLRAQSPEYRSIKGSHYADILERLMVRKTKRLAPAAPTSQGPAKARQEIASLAPSDNPHLAQDRAAATPEPMDRSKIGDGPAIDKSQLQIATDRRIRNKAHLLFVASKPCLICEALPCHAHHITFAQRRGLAIKVSDEFTVPLCVLHHNAVHQSGHELAFWRQQRIDPLTVARHLWEETLRASKKGAP